jgi:hypothetical protein
MIQSIPFALLTTAAAALLSQTEGFSPICNNLGCEKHQQRFARPSTHCNMFTGIVEEMGTVVSLEERDDMVLWDGSKGQGTEMTVKGDVVMEGAYLG